jgi:hypothetical protein
MPQYEMGENNNDQTVILRPALFRNQGERKQEVLKVKRSTEKAKIPPKMQQDMTYTVSKKKQSQKEVKNLYPQEFTLVYQKEHMQESRQEAD